MVEYKWLELQQNCVAFYSLFQNPEVATEDHT